TMELNRAGSHFEVTPEETVELVRRAGCELQRQDNCSHPRPPGPAHRHGTAVHPDAGSSTSRCQPDPGFCPETATPAGDNSLVVGMRKAEQILGVSKVTIYRWLRDGFITGTQLVAGGSWHIRLDDAMRSKVVGAVPDGWGGHAR